MKLKRTITAAVFLLLALAAAQSLPALTPPGATAGIYTRNLAVKKAFFVNFQAEWNRLGINELFTDFLKKYADAEPADLKEIQNLFTTDLFGQEGIAVVYPDGGFFVMARPAAERASTILSSIRSSLENPKKVNGWLIEEQQADDNVQMVVGVSSNALLAASKSVADRFFAGKRGLKMPIQGDFAFWLEAEPLWIYLDDPNLGLPPEAVTAIKTFSGLAGAVNMELDGIHESGSVCFNPDQDGKLASIFLTNTPAWNLGDMPKGVSASVGTLDLPALGEYASDWAKKFGQDLSIDLSAFGERYALIDAGEEDPQAAMQHPLGNLLLLIGTKDSLTAEVTLLSWLQMAAGFSTPEGQGGFSVEPITVAGHDGKKIQLGMAGNIYLVSYDDHLALATSKKALDLLSAPPLKSDPTFAKLAKLLPPSYSAAGYGNYKAALKQAASLMPLMMMQPIDDPDVQELMGQFSAKLSRFFDYVAGRMGGGIQYTLAKDGCLESSGFTQVNW